MRGGLLVAALLCGVRLAGGPALAQTAGPEHDAVADFNLNSNPNGPWTYYVFGTRADKALGDPVADYKLPGLNAWTDGKTAGGAAYIGRNVTSKPLHVGSVVLHKNQLLMYAGNASGGVDVRFITPTKGIYRIKVELTGIDKQQLGAPFGVYAKNHELCSDTIQQYGQTYDCRRTLTLKAGEIIDVATTSFYPGKDAHSAVGLIERIKGPIQKSE